jgi:hypothetical protein
MRGIHLVLAPLVLPAAVAVGVVVASPASAECTSAGGTTVCAQGSVRGSDTGDGPSGAGPYYPYPCGDDWYCGDGWDMDVIVDPGPGRPDFGLPGRPGNRPGGGGGIGRR